jgi:hypothetical protein
MGARMSPAAILADLQARGLTVRAERGQVILAPGERVTPLVRMLVQRHKPAILAALAQEGAAPSPSRAPAAGELPEHQAPASVPGAPPGPAAVPDPLVSRRAFVVAELQAHPGNRYAFDVADAPLLPGPGAPVSAVLAIRTPEGIVTAELCIARERFEFAAFVAELDRAAALEPAPAGATLH